MTPAGPDATHTPETLVWLARIRRPQGRKGEVFADILTDFPDKFAQRRQLWLLRQNASQPARTAEAKPADAPSLRPIQLKHHWLHKGGVVLHFEGVDSISDAERLAGTIVAIPREQRAELAADEVYIADLVGCALIDIANPAAPVHVGEIEDVDRDLGPVPILIVRGSAGEVLVPFAKSYLLRIDLQARRVEMVLPEGLIELNAGG
ncbi:MAG TPA: ribosome maturation factor RimM [Terracidiphilus sp.]